MNTEQIEKPKCPARPADLFIYQPAFGRGHRYRLGLVTDVNDRGEITCWQDRHFRMHQEPPPGERVWICRQIGRFEIRNEAAWNELRDRTWHSVHDAARDLAVFLVRERS